MTSADQGTHGCAAYRVEMLLLELHRRLRRGDLPESERRRIQDEIRRLEKATGLEDAGQP